MLIWPNPLTITNMKNTQNEEKQGYNSYFLKEFIEILSSFRYSFNNIMIRCIFA
jgi:hypothetical protein